MKSGNVGNVLNEYLSSVYSKKGIKDGEFKVVYKGNLQQVGVKEEAVLNVMQHIKLINP